MPKNFDGEIERFLSRARSNAGDAVDAARRRDVEAVLEDFSLIETCKRYCLPLANTADELRRIGEAIDEANAIRVETSREIARIFDKQTRREEIEMTPDNSRIVERALSEKGEWWVVAAMVDGSIGYHSVEGARSLIRAFRAGERRDACERCMACFNGDLAAMMASDVKRFEYIEAQDPRRTKSLLKALEKLEGLSTVEAMTASLMYPTAIL